MSKEWNIAHSHVGVTTNDEYKSYIICTFNRKINTSIIKIGWFTYDYYFNQLSLDYGNKKYYIGPNIFS